MDRHIAFRAWHKAEKRMFKVSYLSWFHGIFLIGDEYSEKNRRFGSGEVELMQYTGLKDKQGKEIYEGDIIEYLDNTSQGLVKKTVTITDIRSLPDFGCSKWEEIKGNIYENSERVEAQ